MELNWACGPEAIPIVRIWSKKIDYGFGHQDFETFWCWYDFSRYVLKTNSSTHCGAHIRSVCTTHPCGTNMPIVGKKTLVATHNLWSGRGRKIDVRQERRDGRINLDQTILTATKCRKGGIERTTGNVCAANPSVISLVVEVRGSHQNVGRF